MHFPVDAVETVAGVYNFSRYDALLQSMTAVGVTVYLILDYFNPGVYGAMPPFNITQAQAFGNYAFAAAAHFQDQGYTDVVLECQNEPNGACKEAPAYVNLHIP